MADITKTYGQAAMDYEALFEELASRYDGLQKPQSVGILKCENQDLAESFKELTEKSRELYGHSFARELVDRGIVVQSTSGDSSRLKPKSEISKEDFQIMLDALAAKYADAEVKPSNLEELKADNPEFKDLLVFFNKRCRLMYGKRTRDKLIEQGIFAAKRSGDTATAEEVEEAIDVLGAQIMQLPEEEKPKTLSDLAKQYPEYGSVIAAGSKAHLTDKVELQKIGILAVSKTQLRKEGIRRASAETLIEDCLSIGCSELILPGGDDAALLPSGILGIDLKNKVELREALACVADAAACKLNVGDTLTVSLDERSPMYRVDSYNVLALGDDRSITLGGYEQYSLYADALGSSPSELSAYVSAEVIGVCTSVKLKLAQIRVRYIAKLQSITLAHLLRRIGIVTEEDVRGNMAWRFRLRQARKKEGAALSAKPAADTKPVIPEKEPTESVVAPAPIDNQSAHPEDLAPLQRSEYEAIGNGDYAFMRDSGIPGRLKEYLRIIADLSIEFPRVRSTDVVAKVGCSKSTFSTALQKLKDAGCVAVDDGYIKLLDGARNKASGSLAGFVCAIEELCLEPPRVRSADVVAELGCSKSTFSGILQELRAQKLVMEKDGYIMLTNKVALGGYSQTTTTADSISSIADISEEDSTAGPIAASAPANDMPTQPEASEEKPIRASGGGLTSLSNIQRAYFETIADLISEGEPIRSVDLAEVMEVSTAAVAKMMPTLKESGLIETDIDGYIKLTPAGYEAAGIEPAEVGPESPYAFANDPSINAAQKKYLQAIVDLTERGQSAKSIDIANELSVSKASVSKMIGILEANGLIRRNGRIIELTEKALGEGVSLGQKEEAAKPAEEQSAPRMVEPAPKPPIIPGPPPPPVVPAPKLSAASGPSVKAEPASSIAIELSDTGAAMSSFTFGIAKKPINTRASLNASGAQKDQFR